MTQETERDREVREKINRLRKRLEGHVEVPQLRDVLKGVLDLLADAL